MLMFFHIAKVRTAPPDSDSPDSPMARMEAKRRKLTADRSIQPPTQPVASTSAETRSKSAKEVEGAGEGKGKEKGKGKGKGKADISNTTQRESSPLSDEDMYS